MYLTNLQLFCFTDTEEKEKEEEEDSDDDDIVVGSKVSLQKKSSKNGKHKFLYVVVLWVD